MLPTLGPVPEAWPPLPPKPTRMPRPAYVATRPRKSRILHTEQEPTGSIFVPDKTGFPFRHGGHWIEIAYNASASTAISPVGTLDANQTPMEYIVQSMPVRSIGIDHAGNATAPMGNATAPNTNLTQLPAANIGPSPATLSVKPNAPGAKQNAPTSPPVEQNALSGKQNAPGVKQNTFGVKQNTPVGPAGFSPAPSAPP